MHYCLFYLHTISEILKATPNNLQSKSLQPWRTHGTPVIREQYPEVYGGSTLKKGGISGFKVQTAVIPDSQPSTHDADFHLTIVFWLKTGSYGHP
jgi:hypothetical protein